MKSEKLMDAITNIDEDLLDEARKEPTAEEKKAIQRGGQILSPSFLRAACAVLVVGILTGAVLWAGHRNDPAGPSEQTGNAVAADPAQKAAALAEAVFPQDWPEGEIREGEPPIHARRTAGYEVAEIYRSYFADMMLLLLSDENGENRVMSPVNIFMATAMLAEMTDGETRQEILNALNVRSLSELRDQAARLWGLCYRDDGQEKLVLGNSLWLSNSLSYRENTVKHLAEEYYASVFRGEMGSEAYDSVFRDWLNQMTGGLLTEQVSREKFSSDELLAFASTVYLQTKWQQEFDAALTSEALFHGADGDRGVPFMHRDMAADFYFRGDNFTMIYLSSRQGPVFFFLPDEGVGVDEMMQSQVFRDFLAYTNDYVMNLSDGFEKTKEYKGMTSVAARVNLTVPKLDIDASQKLNESLQKLGIRKCFSAAEADFTSITDVSGVYLSRIEQSSRLLMDESGISAASYVVGALAGGYPPEDEIDLVIDRPFFLLVTGAGNVPLFAAVVNEP